MNATTEISDRNIEAEMVQASLRSAIEALDRLPHRAVLHILDHLNSDCDRLTGICEGAHLARMRGF